MTTAISLAVLFAGCVALVIADCVLFYRSGIAAINGDRFDEWKAEARNAWPPFSGFWLYLKYRKPE